MLLDLVHLRVNDFSLTVGKCYEFLLGLLLALQSVGFKFVFDYLAVITWFLVRLLDLRSGERRTASAS